MGTKLRAVMWWAGVALLGIAAASALTLGAIWLAQGVARPLAIGLIAAASPALVVYVRLLVREWRSAGVVPPPKPARPVRRAPSPVADEDLAGVSLWDVPPLQRGGASAR